eukprot:2205294-Amphidinium_carterae.1
MNVGGIALFSFGAAVSSAILAQDELHPFRNEQLFRSELVRSFLRHAERSEQGPTWWREVQGLDFGSIGDFKDNDKNHHNTTCYMPRFL